ncbi:MAG: terminase family protein, partial [Candidatus Caldarchaeum sp.]
MTRSDVVQLLLHAAGFDIRLHPWQKNFIDDPSRFRIILKHRGAGATFTIAAEACAEALTHPTSTILLISYSLRQSLEIFRHIRTIFSRLENTRLKHGHSIYRLMAKIGARTVELGNGSRIISLPNNPESLRGYRADAVYVDEAAFFRDDTNLKTAIMFTTVARNGRVTLVSTPKGKRGWFHEAWITENTWSKHLV